MFPSFPILDLLQDCDDPPLTPESLEALQVKLGKRFPQEYAEFLLQFNGGHFVRSVEFSIPQPTEFVTRALVASFLGDSSGGYRHGDLLWYVEAVNDHISPEFLPIALCNSRDYVLLKFEEPGARFAGVWYWDSSAKCVSEDEQEYYWLADTFHEFLEMLVLDVFEFDEDHESLPLFQAVERGALTAIEKYLAEGGDVEARNAQGHTLLIAAAWYQWPKMVKLLVDSGADVNARDPQGRTPLHVAACSSVDSVKLLLAAGADATARDNDGKSVLGEWSHRADDLLRAHGAET